MSTPNDREIDYNFGGRIIRARSYEAAYAIAAQATQPQPPQGEAQACIEQAAKLIVEGKDPNGAVLNLNEALAHVDALQAQRDELLDACKLMVERLEGDIAVRAFDSIRQGGMLPSLYREAKAAIARATEGGQGK